MRLVIAYSFLFKEREGLRVMKIQKNKRGHTKVKFTPEEQEAMNREIEDQLLNFVAGHLLEIEAMMLVQLRQQLGFGKKRLKRFYNGFTPTIYDMVVKNMTNQDGKLANITILDDYGFSLEEWAKEREENIGWTIPGLKIETSEKTHQGVKIQQLTLL